MCVRVRACVLHCMYTDWEYVCLLVCIQPVPVIDCNTASKLIKLKASLWKFIKSTLLNILCI